MMILSRLYLGGRPPLRPFVADAGLCIVSFSFRIWLYVVYIMIKVLSIGYVNCLQFVYK